ncbi:MAG: hypothetical protein ACLQG3_05525 [Terracidiphilus sp.]
MQITLNRLTSPVRSLTAGTWVILFAVLALCLAAGAHAQLPIAVSGTPTQLGALTGGGWDGSQEPIGGTFVVGLNGNVLVGDGYSSNFLQITPSGTDTTLASGVGASNAALDSYGNLYFGGNYNANVYKVPFVSGAYVGWTTAPTTNCQGGNLDTTPCIFAPAVSAYMSGTLAGSGNSGYAGVAFDASGNFFFETNTLPGTDPDTIFECNTTCLASSSATPTLIYKDSNSVGAFGIDPWGNIFFVDGSNGSKGVTNLNEIPLSSGTYASSPTVLESYTNAVSWSNGISGMTISGTGTVYFTTNGDGIFAMPNTKSGGPKVSSIYMVSTQGGKGLAIDSHGNLYGIPYNSGDVVSYIPLNNFSLTATTIGGTASTVSVNVFDSAATCTPSLTESAVEFGVATTEFSITPGSSCSAELGTGNGTFSPALSFTGAETSATVTFSPTAAGERNAAFVIADSANSASGTAALTGVGESAAGNVDPGVITGYTTGLTTPAAIVADPAGDVFIADSGAGKVYEIAAGTSTLVSIGSGFTSPSGLAFDASGDLFIADDGVPDVVEIANTGTTGAFAAGTQSQVAGPSAAPGGVALASATALAVGPDGTVYLADPTNKRVVYLNPITGQAGLTLATSANGITTPAGLAVDSSGNLYVADSTENEIFIFAAAGGISTVTPPSVTTASGVAVDASGSLLVSDSTSGNIVRIPNISGSLSTSKALVTEALSSQASSLWADTLGDLYVASAGGKAAYAIQRTAASVNLGTVQDGVTNSATVYLENAGNETATLASPILTEPSNTMFTLAATGTNGCTSGSTGPAGAACTITATFAPTVGTAEGVQSGSGSIDVTIPAVTFTVNLTGTATPSAILAQTISGFSPTTPLQVGQQTALSATGGDSGNPVTFSIDTASTCGTCVTLSGTNNATLTAVAAGSVTIDANQAAGTNNGNQYAAATTVKATVVVESTLVASDVPALLMNEIVWSYQSGAFTDGQNPAGGSFAITQDGQIVVGTSYDNEVDFVNASTGALTSQVKISGPGGLTIDSSNNLYMSHLYGPSVLKIPYVNGAYATLSDTSPANCTGSDTALCTFASVPSGGVKAIAFDPSGNFYMVTVPASPGTSAIYECAASCQTGGTGTLVYSDVNSVSQIAFDPWGNMFFTEGVYTSSTNFGNLNSASSNLNELKYTSGTGFASTPTLLQTLTIASPGSYDNQLDGVAVTSTGTIYYATQNEGMFAIPNTETGGPDTAHQYVVSSLGAKGMELDANGNEWVVVYHSGGDNLGEALIGDLTTPNAQYDGAAVNASATVVDNAFGCGTAAALAIASTNSEFAATAGTTCSSISANFSTAVSASSYPATITFTATKPATQTATLTVSDTTNGGVGTATVTGYALTTPQTLTFTAPTTTTVTYTPGMTITVSVTNGGSNQAAVFTVDSKSTGAGTFSSTTVTGTTSTATLTVTQAGSIVIDANEAGGLVSGVYYDTATQAQLTLTVNTASQTIVFPQPTTPLTYSSGLTASLSANGGASGNAVVFTVDSTSTGAGTISASTLSNGTSTATLTVTGAGSIVIDANQPGNVDYAAATQVQQTIVVNQATQTISFNSTTSPSPFHYIASCSVTSQCAIVTFSATGGGTNNAITLSTDKSSAVQWTLYGSSTKSGTTTAEVELPPGQSLTYPASLVIDLNQTGNTNYLAATQLPITISVQAPLPTQTITFSQPQTQVVGTTLTLAATSSSGLPVTYASSTTSVCTVSGSTVTFLSSVTTTSACTITATQPGDNIYYAAAVPVSVTFAVNPAGEKPSMTIGLSLSSLTIEPGTIGLTQISLGSVNNFAAGTVTFACSGLPSGYSCSFNPASLTAFAPNSSTGVPTGTTAATTLSVSTPSSAAMIRHDYRPIFPATLAVALCFLGIRRRNRLFVLLMLVVLLAGFGMLSGCGGSSSSSTGTATTSSVTVSATGGGSTVSSTLTVILE